MSKYWWVLVCALLVGVAVFALRTADAQVGIKPIFTRAERKQQCAMVLGQCIVRYGVPYVTYCVGQYKRCCAGGKCG